MSDYVTCGRCLGKQTLSVRGEDFEVTCDVCDGQGVTLDDAGEPESDGETTARMKRGWLAEQSRATAWR